VYNITKAMTDVFAQLVGDKTLQLTALYETESTEQLEVRQEEAFRILSHVD